MEMAKVTLAVVLGLLCLFVGSVRGDEAVGGDKLSPPVTAMSPPQYNKSQTPFQGNQGIGVVPAYYLGNSTLLKDWCANPTTNRTEFEDAGCPELTDKLEKRERCEVEVILFDAVKEAWKNSAKPMVINALTPEADKTRARVCNSNFTSESSPTTTTSTTVPTPKENTPESSTTTTTTPSPNGNATQGPSSAADDSTPPKPKADDSTPPKPKADDSTPPKPKADDSNSGGLSGWEIAFIVIGVLAAVILLGFAVYRYTKRAGFQASSKTPTAAGEPIKNEGSDV